QAGSIEPELLDDVLLLVLLRDLERVGGRAEIRAGILHVLVEECLVQRAGQIVVMTNIAARGGDRDAPRDRHLQPLEPRPLRQTRMIEIARQQLEQRARISFFDREGAVHVAPAKVVGGPGQQAEIDESGAEPDLYARLATVPEGPNAAARID